MILPLSCGPRSAGERGDDGQVWIDRWRVLSRAKEGDCMVLSATEFRSVAIDSEPKGDGQVITTSQGC